MSCWRPGRQRGLLPGEPLCTVHAANQARPGSDSPPSGRYIILLSRLTPAHRSRPRYRLKEMRARIARIGRINTVESVKSAIPLSRHSFILLSTARRSTLVRDAFVRVPAVWRAMRSQP